jgi:DNA-binding NarL/FixJ family response regulator
MLRARPGATMRPRWRARRHVSEGYRVAINTPAAAAGTISVVLADDQDLVREGLKSVLDHHGSFSVAGEARTGHEAIDLVRTFRPDLVVMDVRLPGMDGVEACREIRRVSPESGVLFLTWCGDEQSVMSAIAAGARGYTLKSARIPALVDAMVAVGRGGSVLDHSSAATVLEKLREGTFLTREERLAQRLTDRELAVLDLIAEGLTNREIGDRLFFSEKTIKHHVSDILAKLGFARRVEAAAFAIRRNSLRTLEPAAY